MEHNPAVTRLKGYFRNRRSREAMTVYHVVRHVSRSGMKRDIEFFIIRNNKPLNITRSIASTLDYRVSPKTGGLVVNGCGMDMGFSVVYNLSHRLFAGTSRHKASKRAAGYLLHSEWL